MKYCGVVVLACGLLTGCNSQDLSCSAEPAKALVAKIAKDAWAREMFTQLHFSVEKSEFKLGNIRTSSKTEYKAECAADIEANTVLNEQTARTNSVRSGDVSIPVTYTLQMTEDKRLHATVNGL